MSRSIIVAALLLAQPTPAAACHHFTIWRYPWPQRCSPPARLVRHALPPEAPTPPIVLPNLTPIEWSGDADEGMRREVLLRALLGGK